MTRVSITRRMKNDGVVLVGINYSVCNLGDKDYVKECYHGYKPG